jgi:hypothetical protein
MYDMAYTARCAFCVHRQDATFRYGLRGCLREHRIDSILWLRCVSRVHWVTGTSGHPSVATDGTRL